MNFNYSSMSASPSGFSLRNLVVGNEMFMIREKFFTSLSEKHSDWIERKKYAYKCLHSFFMTGSIN